MLSLSNFLQGISKLVTSPHWLDLNVSSLKAITVQGSCLLHLNGMQTLLILLVPCVAVMSQSSVCEKKTSCQASLNV